jgi:hypothetical protein
MTYTGGACVPLVEILTFLIGPISAMVEILSRFASMPHSVMMYPRSFPPGDTKDAFFWVQLNVELPEVIEGFFQIRDEAATLSGFYHDVVNVHLEVTHYLLFETKLHAPLICSPCLL